MNLILNFQNTEILTTPMILVNNGKRPEYKCDLERIDPFLSLRLLLIILALVFVCLYILDFDLSIFSSAA